MHATNRVLSPAAEADAEEACAPCGLLPSCTEEDGLTSARAPLGLLSTSAEEDVPPSACPTPPCALLPAVGWDAPLSHDRSLGNKGLLGKGSLLLWPNRIGHNKTPLPALVALSCCRKRCCLLSSLACHPPLLLLHRTLNFLVEDDLALLKLCSARWACAFVLKGNNLRAASKVIPLRRARWRMHAVLVTTLVTYPSRKESPKHSIMIIFTPLLSSLSLSLRGQLVFVK